MHGPLNVKFRLASTLILDWS